MRISNFGLVALAAALLATVPAYADVTVSTKPTANMSCTGGVCSPTSSNAVLNSRDLKQMLLAGNVTLKSTAEAPDIVIDATLSWASSRQLTLDAYHAIAVNKLVSIGDRGELTITTNDGGTGGDYRFFETGRIVFRSTTGSLYINGVGSTLMKNVGKIAHRLNKFKVTGNTNMALMDNDDLTDAGTYTSSPVVEYKTGSLRSAIFEGLGNTISNLTINTQAGGPVGLFGTVDENVTIRDLNVQSVNIQSSLSQLTSLGVIGYLNIFANVLYCHSSGIVSSNSSGTVGGLVGVDEGTISASASEADVSAGANGVAGGLAGVADYAVDQSHAAGAVVVGDNGSAGGLAGWIEAPDSLNTIKDAYATGSVSGGNGASVGGLIGKQQSGGSLQAVIGNVYSTGAVVGGTSAFIGGFIGDDVGVSRISNSYWDMDTSGVSDSSKGAGSPANDPGITGLSDAQLKSGLPTGFDPKIWAQNPSINNGYPYLIANPPPK